MFMMPGDTTNIACYTQLVSNQSYTYPLWKTPTIAFTIPEASSSFADIEDCVCFSVTVPSASNTSQPKTPAGSDASSGFFNVWVSTAIIFSICDWLKTQI